MGQITYSDSDSSARHQAGPSRGCPSCAIDPGCDWRVLHVWTGRYLPLDSESESSEEGHKEWMKVGLRCKYLIALGCDVVEGRGLEKIEDRGIADAHGRGSWPLTCHVCA